MPRADIFIIANHDKSGRAMPFVGKLKRLKPTCPAGEWLNNVICLAVARQKILKSLKVLRRGRKASAIHKILKLFTGDFDALIITPVAPVFFDQLFEIHVFTSVFLLKILYYCVLDGHRNRFTPIYCSFRPPRPPAHILTGRPPV